MDDNNQDGNTTLAGRRGGLRAHSSHASSGLDLCQVPLSPLEEVTRDACWEAEMDKPVPTWSLGAQLRETREPTPK